MPDQFPSFPISFGPSFPVSFPITGGGLDPDASTYIALIEGDGVTVSSAQKAAINDWYVTGKSEGWYSNLARHYLPIWANASANARCMVSGTSGTFVGAVTHAAGYVQGDGSTGYFDTSTSPGALGVTSSNAWIGGLIYDFSGNSQQGVYSSASTTLLLVELGTLPGFRSEICGSSGRDDSATASLSDAYGILSMGRQSGVTRHRLQRSAGLTISNDFARADAGTIPSDSFYFLARHRTDLASVDQYMNGKMGLAWIGTTPSGNRDESFSVSEKTLWETCTGLTLP